MKLRFLDRHEEASRLRRLMQREEGGFAVLYGRRRCGKSRLLREVIPEGSVYFVGDDREAALQRASLATEIGRVLSGFDRVVYPDWDVLLQRWWDSANTGTVLVLDELPAMVAQAGELPSLLQKRIDQHAERGLHLLVAGSSQRMMQGLVLDQAAPLYGRASELLKVTPLLPGWIREALCLADAAQAVEAYAVWGGIPRYWELAADYPDQEAAVRSLVLDPLGVLHDEPGRILLDDLRDTTQPASLLSLIGRGCHRVSEIAGRLGKPATSLGRPLQRLMDIGLVTREVPFGAPLRGSRRTLYRISDPLLRFWFRFVEPNRSRLAQRQLAAVEHEIGQRFAQHVGEAWEDLARQSTPLLPIAAHEWGPASRWWGAGLDRRPLEVDLVAESLDGSRLLVGEVKWQTPKQAGRLLHELQQKANRLPFVEGREVVTRLWLAAQPDDLAPDQVITPDQVLSAMR